MKISETSFSTDAYIIAEITNQGSGASGEIEVKGRFYDGDENLLDSTTVRLDYLKPGETWEAYIPYFDDGSEVKSHTTDGKFSRSAPLFDVSGLSIEDTQLEKGEYGATVTGMVVNTLEEEADYLAAKARYWRGDVVLAAGLDNITDVPAGENWSFDASYSGYGDRWKDADDYDVIPELAIY